jgi:folate-binding protein YgfZ
MQELKPHLKGLFKEDITLITVKGPHAQDFLQGQLTQDITALKINQWAQTLLLSPEGKCIAYLIVAKIKDDEFYLFIESEFADLVLLRLNRYKIRAKVDFDKSQVKRLYNFNGTLLEQTDTIFEYNYLYNDFNSQVIIVSANKNLTNQACVSQDAFELEQIKNLVPKMGAEITQDRIPFEISGLVEKTVSFTKGCYVGQELVARLDARGKNVAWKLRLFKGQDLFKGQQFYSQDKLVGFITRAKFDAGLGRFLALGFVHRSVKDNYLTTQNNDVVELVDKD